MLQAHDSAFAHTDHSVWRFSCLGGKDLNGEFEKLMTDAEEHKKEEVRLDLLQTLGGIKLEETSDGIEHLDCVQILREILQKCEKSESQRT